MGLKVTVTHHPTITWSWSERVIEDRYSVLSSFISDDFRVFCGDLGNEVTDEILTRNFSKYPSFLKAKVVRDKKTNKSKGYGFLSFKDPNDFIKAMREMNGKSQDQSGLKL